MGRNIFAFGWVVIGLVGCGSPDADLKGQIQRWESDAFVGDSLRVDIRQKLLIGYADFARLHPDDPFVPEALMRRADLLISAGKYEQAVLQLQDLHDGHPSFKKQAMCAFLVAFVYDEHLKDQDLARRAYKRVMAIHPGTPEASLAEQSLAWMDRD